MAGADGGTVLSVSCTRAEQEVPLAALGRLVESGRPGIWELPTATDPAPDGEPPGLPGEPEGAVPSAAIVALARDRPVVIAVDDIDRADRWSVRHLLRIASRAPWARILVVVTERTTTGRHRSELLDELLHSSGARTVGTSNLSLSAVRELLDVVYGLPPDSPAVDRCWIVTAGNPLLLHALASSITGHDRPSPEFHAVVRGMLRSLDRPTVDVMRAIAVLADHAGDADVPAMVGVPPTRLGRIVADLENIGLLRAGTFCDASVRDEVEADMDDAEQVTWHLRAAQHLQRGSAPVQVVAGHVLRAGRAPNPDMVEALVTNAAQLTSDDAHEARRCLELARRWVRDPAVRADIDFALVRVEHQVAPASAVRRLPSVTSAIPDHWLRSHEIAELVEIIGWHDGPEACTELISRVHGAPPAGGRGAVELESCRMLLTTVFPDLAGEPGWTSEAGSDTGPRRFPARLRLDMLAFARSVLRHGWTTELAEAGHNLLLRPTSLPSRDARAVFIALTAMAGADRPPSPSVFDRLIDSATARSSAGEEAMFLAARADAHLSRGRIGDAERDARSALDAVPAGAWGVGIGQPLATLIRATTEAGNDVAAAELVRVPVPDALYESVFGLAYLNARGGHQLALGQFCAALEDFRTCGRLISRWGLDHDGVAWRYGAARALLSLDRRAEARELLVEQLADSVSGVARGLALRLTASLDVSDTAPRLLNEAHAMFDVAGNGLESARTLAKISECHERQGEFTLAREKRSRARRLAQECGAPQLVEQLTRVPGTVPDPIVLRMATPTGGDAVLTEAESRVVELVMQGRTNREISDRLFVTVSTVEQHLTSVFRKLGVKRRRELARLYRSDMILSLTS